MNTDLPLYKQIIIGLENDILAGTLPPGQRIPSIRELAAQYQVNPNTAQRAVQEMKYAGLLTSPRGKGTLVTNDADFICRFRQKRGEELVHSFIRQMEMLDYSHEQVKALSLAKICDDG